MRKDVRFALTVGGVFFCSIITYAIVLREGGSSLDQPEESVVVDPATKPAPVAPATKPAKSTALASGAKPNASGSAATRRSDYSRSQYASNSGGSNYSGYGYSGSTTQNPRNSYSNYNATSNYNSTPATRPAPAMISQPATRPQTYASSTSTAASPSVSAAANPNGSGIAGNSRGADSTPANRTFASIDSSSSSQTIEPQHTITPSVNRTDVLAARQPAAIVNPNPPLIDAPVTRPIASSAETSRITPRSPVIESAPIVKSSPATRPNPTYNPVQIASGNKTTHKILSGESLWTISAAVYGNGSYYNKIALANPSVDPKHLKPGMVLVIPDLGTAEKTAVSTPAATPPSDPPKPLDETKQYRVQSGDTLERISNRLYGTPRVKDKIYEMNKSLIGDDPDKLKIGWVLSLPQPPRSAN